MTIAITAIGTSNPIYKRSQQDTAELITSSFELKASEKRLLKSIYRATGIAERYSVLSDYNRIPGEFEFFPNDSHTPFPSTSARMQIYKDNALGLALTAIKKCIATLDKSEITHLITISCTGMYAPGLDIEIVQELNLNSDVKRTAINFMGCYGAFNGIKVAESICRADAKAKVLMVSVELCTIHFQRTMNVDNILANAIFADGAAAILIQAEPQGKKYLSLEDFHCDLLPQTTKEMAWHISDYGFDILLSTYVPEIIKNGILKFMQRLLTKRNLSLEEVDVYAIHPGGLKILQACEEALSINEEQNKYSYHVLRQYGNMSSATILFVLKEIWDDMSTQFHQKNIFSCAFGPGLTLESMLLRAHST